ncbi:MAG: Gfo/Idh/MocA family protein [Planctomycetota bacterium]
MKGELKVLLYGAGDMAGKHADAYQRLSTARLVAVANRSPERAEKLCRDFAIPRRYADLTEALEKERPHIVSLCVPTAFHPEAAKKAFEAGAHVLSEKPIALTAEEGMEMIERAKKADRKLSVIFNRRFNTVWDELKRRMDSIGTPVVYNTQEIRSIRPKRAMHTRSLNNGPVVDCCVHDFDMLIHSLGKAKTVFASGTVFGSNKPFLTGIEDPAVDTAHINVELEKGDRAYLFYGWGFPEGPGYWQHRDFMGPNGIVRLMGEFGHEVHHYREDGKLEVVYDLEENGHAVIVRRFVEAVLYDKEVPVKPEDAVEALKISLAALRSVESGEKESV